MNNEQLYRRAKLSEIGVDPVEFAQDPLGAIRGAVGHPNYERWATSQLVSATKLRSLFDEPVVNQKAAEHGTKRHAVFASKLRLLEKATG